MRFHGLYHSLAHFGLIGVFIGVFGEALMLPFPSETLVTLGSVAASKGVYPYWLLVMVSFVGSYVGSLAGYGIGRLIGKAALHQLYARLKIPKSYILNAETRMVRYSAPLFIVYRFLPIVRGIIPYIAGANLFPFRSFALLSGLGSVLWVVTFTVFGRVLVKYIRILMHLNVQVIIIVIFVALISGYTGYRLGLAKKNTQDE
ncbi:DedA family protein [Alicyclobacillus curvatus]|nr:DedA family protein [Alicyclobacillus curvatus]